MDWNSVEALWHGRQSAPLHSVRSEELLRRYLQDRCESDFRELLSRYGANVYLQCRAILRCENLAGDVFQETFVTLIKKGHTIRHYDRIGAWLTITAQRKALNLRRHIRKGMKIEQLNEKASLYDQTSNLVQLETQAAVHGVINQLPEKYRTVLQLCFYDGMTHAAVAKQLQIPQGTVDSWVRRGLKLAKKKLVKQGVALPFVVIQTLIASKIEAVPPHVIHATLKAVGMASAQTGMILAVSVVWGFLAAHWHWCLVLLGLGVSVGSFFVVSTKQPDAPVLFSNVRTSTLPDRRETTRHRNLEIIRSDVIPKLSSALKSVLLWNQVDVIEVKSEEMIISVVLELKAVHRNGKPWLTSRTEWFFNTVTHKVYALFDPKADGKWEPIRDDYVQFHTAISPSPIRFRFSALTKSYEAFQVLMREPWDLYPSEWNKDNRLVSIIPYLGSWYPEDPNNTSEFRFMMNTQGELLCIEPDGRIQNTHPKYADGKATIHLWSIPLVLENEGKRLRTIDNSWWVVRRESTKLP